MEEAKLKKRGKHTCIIIFEDTNTVYKLQDKIYLAEDPLHRRAEQTHSWSAATPRMVVPRGMSPNRLRHY